MKTLLLYLFVFLSILHNQTIILENQKILLFFMNQLLPSLFLLCVLIQLLPLPKIKKTVILKIFQININTLFLVIKMIFLGNPGSCYFINDLVKKKTCTEVQAERLINCVSIPSISFMFMSIPFMTSKSIAYTIFILHLISIFILLFLTRKTPLHLNIEIKQVSLFEALLFSIKTMALILSYLFIVISIQSLFLIYFPQIEKYLFLFMEFSSGTKYFSTHPEVIIYLLICIGFGGFCSHLQIISGCDEIKLSYTKYFIYRIIHLLLNLMLYQIFSIFFNL